MGGLEKASFYSACYASVVFAMALCPFVRLSQVSFLLKMATHHVGLSKQCHMIALGLHFSDAKDCCKIRPESTLMGAPNVGGIGKNGRLSINNSLYLENGTRYMHILRVLRTASGFIFLN